MSPAKDVWFRIGEEGYWGFEAKREGYNGSGHLYYSIKTGSTATPELPIFGNDPSFGVYSELGEMPFPTLLKVHADQN